MTRYDSDLDTWSTLPSDVIFYLEKLLTQEDFKSVRLVNKHWSEAGRSFITKLKIYNENKARPQQQLRPLLKHFSHETFHQLRQLKIFQFKNGHDSLSYLTKLSSLDITSSSANTQEFAALKFLVNLNSLSLRGTPLRDQGMQYLSGLTNLSTLCLEWCSITEASVLYLADMTNLSYLSLQGLQVISEKCLEPLRGMKSLIGLDLSRIYLSGRALNPLSNLTNLCNLNLSTNDITSESLSEISGLCYIKKLDLSYTRVGNEGLRNIRSLQRLKELNLSGSYVDDGGLRYLTRFKFLSDLDLSDNFMVCCSNLQHLMPLTRLSSLRWMNLCNTQANETGVEMFRAAIKPREIKISY
eukprot:g241.t1